MPYGFYKKILAEIKEEEPWINLNLINFAFTNYSERKEFESNQAPPDASSIITPSTIQGGGPKDSTNIKEHHLKELVLAAKNKIATITCVRKKRGEGKDYITKWLVEQQNCTDNCQKRYPNGHLYITYYYSKRKRKAKWFYKVVEQLVW